MTPSKLDLVLIAAFISDRHSYSKIDRVIGGLEEDLYVFSKWGKGAHAKIVACPAGVVYHVHVEILLRESKRAICTRMNVKRFGQ